MYKYIYKIYVLVIILSELFIPSITSGIKEKHPRKALKEARKLSETFDISKLVQGRVETTGVTIDSLISKDLDDGIDVEKLPSGKGYILRVSIASPTEMIPHGSEIDKEAYRRATSIYFSESRVYHMLPNLISTGIGSLNDQEHRLTLTLELELDKDFEVRRKDVYPSTFFNRKRHSPESFQSSFSNTADTEYEYFAIMHELARGLREKRDDPQRITDFDDADRRIVMGEVVPGHSNSHISSFVIQEFMILANIEMAKFMEEHSIYGVYRSHMPEYKDGRELPKTLERAEYSSIPGFHTGLWLPRYMHFTSPLRRLADYISHRQILAVLYDNPQIFSQAEISDLCTFTNIQIASLIQHQKNETRDDRGKQIIRRNRRNGGEKDTSIISHIKDTQNKGLKVPKTVRDEIIMLIRGNGMLESWIIENFLFSDEAEIVEAIKERILNDEKSSRYFSIISAIKGINLQKKYTLDKGRVCFEIRGTVFGRRIKSMGVIPEAEPIPNKLIDGSSLAKNYLMTINGQTYILGRRSCAKAHSRVLKRTLEKILTEE